jgi:hypothetical protein
MYDMVTSTRSLLESGVIVHVLNLPMQRIDMNDPHGKFVFHLFGALAELEREIVSHRIKTALKHRRANGLQVSTATEIGWDTKCTCGTVFGRRGKKCKKCGRTRKYHGHRVKSEYDERLAREFYHWRHREKRSWTWIAQQIRPRNDRYGVPFKKRTEKSLLEWMRRFWNKMHGYHREGVFDITVPPGQPEEAPDTNGAAILRDPSS